MTTMFYRNPRSLALALLIILVGGLSAFMTIPREEDPKYTNRFATIITAYPGATAERVERLVTEKIEEKLQEKAEIKEIRSQSRNGISIVSLELEGNIYDTAGPFSEIRDAVADAEAAFPAGALPPIFDADRGYAFTFLVALTWDSKNPVDLAILKRLARELQSQLRNTSGTELVTLHGAPDEEISVTVEPAVVSSLGLDADAIARAIAAADSKVSAGQLRGTANEILLEVRGELDSLSRIRDVPIIQGADGAIVRLGDVARVDRAIVQPPRSLALVEGKEGVVVAVRMEGNRSIDHWVQSVKATIADFESGLSEGIGLKVIFDQSTYTAKRFGGLFQNVLVGAGLVIAVLLVTLGWRAALVVSAAIPLTVLVSLTVLGIAGIPINQMSVTGLIVALGLVVDAAIIMTDAVQRHLGRNLPPMEAVAESIRRLWVPLLSSTLTTVLGFMPITLLPGNVGEFISPMALSVITAVTVSFLLAVTIVPAIAGRFLSVRARPQRNPSGARSFWHSGVRMGTVARLFERLIEISLAWPRSTILAASILPSLGFVGATTLTSQFFPEADRNQLQIELRLPTQSSISKTESFARRAYDLLMAHEEIEAVNWFIGSSAPKFYYNLLMNQDGQPNYAEAQVTIRSIGEVKDVIREVQAELNAAFPEAEILVRQILQGPQTFAPVELRIYGDDLQTLKEVGEQARLIFSRIPEIVATRASIAGGEPKLWLNADEDEARSAGLSLVDVARQLDGMLEGSLGVSLVEGGEELPIRVRVRDSYRGSFAGIASLDLLTANRDGGLIDFLILPLSALGSLELAPAADTITHFQGRRVNVISGYIQAGRLPATAVGAFQRLWKESGYALPDGYRIEWTGDTVLRCKEGHEHAPKVEFLGSETAFKDDTS